MAAMDTMAKTNSARGLRRVVMVLMPQASQAARECHDSWSLLDLARSVAKDRKCGCRVENSSATFQQADAQWEASVKTAGDAQA